MADTKSELERIYTIPLRGVKMGTRSKRADRAVREVRAFLTRHMKSDQIWLDNEVNQALWSRGKFHIRSRIRVRATRFADGVVEVTMPDQTTTGSVREEIQERREKAAETPVLAPMAEEEHEHVAGDDTPVTAVAGVGPATAEKLEKAEIETVADLAAADAAEVAATIGTPTETVQKWIDAAKTLQSEAEAAEAAETDDGEATDDGDAEDTLAADDSEE